MVKIHDSCYLIKIEKIKYSELKLHKRKTFKPAFSENNNTLKRRLINNQIMHNCNRG